MALPSITLRPSALDLFCGGGGAGEGLRQAGFHVIGVDRSDHKESYEQNGKVFVLHDVMELPVEYIKQFDLVWSSPPCQAFCSIIPKSQREKHEKRWKIEGRHINYIPRVRSLLKEANVTFAIENVEAARGHLIDPVKLCGTMFDLSVYRHRLIECFGFVARAPCKCDHRNSGIGALSGGVKPVAHERYETELAAELKAGETPPGFVAKCVNFPSRRNTTRIDHIYVGVTDEVKELIKKTYKRNFCRSVKEMLRLTNELRDLTDEEKDAERQRYEADLCEKLPKGAKQMFPIYGLSASRGSNNEWSKALGLQVSLSRKELRESIPPSYSKYLASQFFLHKSICL